MHSTRIPVSMRPSLIVTGRHFQCQMEWPQTLAIRGAIAVCLTRA